MIKRIFNGIFQTAFFSQLLGGLDDAAARRPNQLRVLTYHRINDQAGFKQQMQYLAKHFYVVSQSELAEAWRGNRSLPPRSVMITFDDAYRNFAECAWPILQCDHLPVTLFVPTAFPDHPELVFWWDQLEHAFAHTQRSAPLNTPQGPLPLATRTERVQAYKRARTIIKTRPHIEAMALVERFLADLNVPAPESQVLGWNDLRRLAGEGVTLGAHTRTHPMLKRVPVQQAREEASCSLEDLKREIGSAAPIFAYPDGQFTPEVVKAIGESGFEFAFTTLRGSNDIKQAERLRLRRNNVGVAAARPVLQLRLLQAALFNGQR